MSSADKLCKQFGPKSGLTSDLDPNCLTPSRNFQNWDRIIPFIWFKSVEPGRVAQSVTCLATDASLTADPGVASSIPAWSHTFVEIRNNFYGHSPPFR